MEFDIIEILKRAVEEKVSDIFIISGYPLSFKTCDRIHPVDMDGLSSYRLKPEDTKKCIEKIYTLGSGRDIQPFLQSGDDDFSFSIEGLCRFRCNTYLQRGSMAAVLRVVAFRLPDPKVLHIPDTVIDLNKIKKGLVLITGSAGSGKSTTLACIIDKINHTRNSHIITIEDPIEYLHRHDRSIVSQRELANDTKSYVQALRAALRQAPNVILLGEMRDYETITTAMTAAETGQLVLSTLHTVGAANTIDRIIDVFPPNQQQQIRVQLSMVLQAVVSQQLIPTVDGGLVPAFEIMLVNPAIRNLIRESKVHQIDNTIYSCACDGMVAMDMDLLRLWEEGKISAENALIYAANPETLKKKLDS
ncbi:type IV pilus twitching motility protein PilT [Caproiciproducens faecalis]|uniref:PilT/PilU family type 4a pilus ATPase n=1 Tax=Caproiciproducens faecalis TaxID=2820301 RepID=A0ABS7DP08_9FIRM|nr:PilT/PilU family type 4a pilus ATPase [Caproiciproducens faecalis]MBW7572933.1 PilT/PilU family type 4a pilus ATPase [Caproiciproducens faecalis]